MGLTLPLAFAAQAEAPAEVADISVLQALAVAALMFAIGASLVPVMRKASARLLGATPPRVSSFLPLDLLVVALVFVFGQVLVVEAYRFWSGAAELDLESLGVIPALGLSAASQGLAVAVVVVLALRREHGVATLGLRDLTPGARGAFAGACYLLSIPTLMGLGALTAAIFAAQGAGPPVQDVAVLVEEGLSESPLLIGALVALVIPLLEEILFRGFLLELLVSRAGVTVGVVVSSALFALLHGLSASLPIFGLALVLAAVKLRTRSLGAAWAVHALHNGATTLLITGGGLPT